ncbi:MAG: hypothetical protein BGP13_12795 [Sphingobacteriales bacterium 40-81]|nr:MAG: hypothetical protein BGP13_12795 [Sphingobacteriales bacterium 40-81]
MQLIFLKLYAGLLLVFSCGYLNAQVAVPGQPLPSWKEGMLDLHHINTGWGDAAFYIFPDGTTMLFDAGEMNPTDERAFTPRNARMRPDYSRRPYEWVAYYIQKVAPLKEKTTIDYAAISHFHDDHFGSWYPGAKLSVTGKYSLTGITGVGELIPIQYLLDRGYPDYNYPFDMKGLQADKHSGEINFAKTMQNYFAFTEAQQQRGMKIGRLKAGSRTQIAMKYTPAKYPEFYVRNIKANGLIWNGKDAAVVEFFPPVDTANRATWPSENGLSLVFVIHYGSFTYYSGGDCGGIVSYGDAAWKDIETPVAKVIGEVDVATLDHHGNRDAVNEFQVKTFKPRVWIQQSWSSDHPGEEVLRRLTTPYLYKEPRDLFTTNMLDANRYVIGSLIDRSYKSLQGHIVVRVMPGGKEYYIIILDDSTPDMPVKAVFGPYISKIKK